MKFIYVLYNPDSCNQKITRRFLSISSFFRKLLELPPNGIGDTLAGLFGSFAVLAAIVAVILQSVELSGQRIELARQANEAQQSKEALIQQGIENSIFEMMRTHIELVNGLDLRTKEDGNIIATGRDCFKSFYTSMARSYREKKTKHVEPVARYYAYKALWHKHGDDLGHYFRFLYNSFKFIADTNEETRYKYGRLFRAQLSDSESLIIFYNCLSDRGRPFLKFAKEFELFDNLPVLKLLSHSHYRLIDIECFGQNPLVSPKEYRAREKHIISELKAGRQP